MQTPSSDPKALEAEQIVLGALSKPDIVRLKRRADFLSAKKGARSHGRAFVLQCHDRQDSDSQIRIGFTVTKKVGNSVERNRVRRRLREAVKGLILSPQWPSAFAGKDIVIIARRIALTLPFSEISKDLQNSLHQLVAKRPANGQKRRQHAGGKSAQGVKPKS